MSEREAAIMISWQVLPGRRNCKEQETLKEAILKEIPEAQVEFVVGEEGETIGESLEI